MLNMLQVRLESMQSQQQQWIAEVNKLAGRIQELSELMGQMRELVAEDKIMIDLEPDKEYADSPLDENVRDESEGPYPDVSINDGFLPQDPMPAYDNSIEPPV